MKFAASAAFAVLACGLQAVAAASVTPVQKVIELLHDMQVKAEKAKKEEVVQWSAYKRWCSDSEYDKQNLVKAADLELASLKATVEKHDTEAHRLSQLIVGHKNDIVNFKADIEIAQELRANESKAHALMHEDYSESIHALTEAIKVLKEQDYDRPQAIALLQHLEQRTGLLLEARQKVEAFLAQASERADVASLADPFNPEAHGYEFQSGGIVQMLQDLLTQFQTDKTNLEKEELTRRHETERRVLDLTSQISSAENEIEKNTKHEAEHKQASADAHAQWTSLDATRADDMQFLNDLDTSCNQKQLDFEARQKLRQEEVEALQQAVDILSSDKVSGNAQKHLPTMVQSARKVASFLQLGRRSSSPPKQAAAAPQAAGALKERATSAAAYLQRAGKRVGSEVLAVLAARVQAGSEEADVFDKVKQMISDLIARLQAEEGEEASHKAWCDQEMGTNEQTRTTKSALVTEKKGDIDQATSNIAKLNQEVADLSKAVATLSKEMAEALRLRDDERNQNEATIADAVEGRMAVGQAITILQNYYGRAAQATVLAQQAPPPATFSKAFKGQQTESDNIIAFLQVIQSDFARLETDTSAAEQTAQSQYQTDSAAALADKQAKEGSITAKNNQLVIEKGNLQTASNDLDLAQADLTAALAYYDKLKPSCVGPSVADSYKARVERREGEIESLKEALSILNGQTLVSGPESLYSSVDGGNRGMDIGITADKA